MQPIYMCSKKKSDNELNFTWVEKTYQPSFSCYGGNISPALYDEAGGGNDKPLWYSCLGNSMDIRPDQAIAHVITKVVMESI